MAITTYITADGRPALASAGNDRTVRRWDATTGTEIGEPLTGHIGWVSAITAYTTVDGRPALASAGSDGTVRRWDATSGTEIGEALMAHDRGVWAVAAYSAPDGGPFLATCGSNYALAARGLRYKVRRWDAMKGRWHPDFRIRDLRIRKRLRDEIHGVTTYNTPDGRPALASAGGDGTVRRWDATTGTEIGEPLAGHTGDVWAVAAYTTVDERPALASAGSDGTVRRWDAITGVEIGEPMSGHTGRVGAITAYTIAGGRPALASAGFDGTVRRWDATTGVLIGGPLDGHTGSVLAITSYAAPDGRPQLASTGTDGTVLLWDATTGELLRRLYVAPIQLRGLADRPASRDLLGRQALTEELAKLLTWHVVEADREPGPNVITVEGPWGSGKTSIMGLVRDAIVYVPPERTRRRPMSVRVARKLLGHGTAAEPVESTPDSHRGAVTAWFNPWAHQSSEQIWAGLARAIIEAAEHVLLSDEDASQRYWFTRNVNQVDRHAVRRRLVWRSISPLFGLAAVAGLSTTLFKVAALKQQTLWRMEGFRITPGVLALALGGALLLAASIHTAVRYFGRAAALLPAELVRGPVLSGAIAQSTPAISDALRDPLYDAKSGYLYLIQHDMDQLVADLQAAGYELVVFIDDLDRCSAGITAQVFEAINLFLSGTSRLEAKFVIGLDPTVVAAHLDKVYADLADPTLVLHGDDPTPGWAFLRKVVQLPVGVPHVRDDSLDHFVANVLNAPGPIRQATATGPPAPEPASRPPAGPLQQPGTAVGPPPPKRLRRERIGPVERQPEVLDIIRQRLLAQPQRSAREAKRLLNVWQLYLRLLDRIEPVRDDDVLLTRACHLVILAEIVTRWPALQRRLHQPVDGRRGLQMLAAAADDDARWRTALTRVGLRSPKEEQPTAVHERALSNLRTLLNEHNGRAVADLAARLL